MSLASERAPARRAVQESACLARLDAELISLVRRALHARLHLGGRPEGPSLDRPAYTALAVLSDHGPQRGSELAATLGLDLSTVSRQLSTLESLGLVERRPDPRDRRAHLLAATTAGQEIFQENRAARWRALHDVLESWSARDRAELTRLLARFNASLDARKPPLPPSCTTTPLADSLGGPTGPSRAGR
ncbi:MAG: MarR family winged helix-turn-helix transcriptional regulator [Mycobacteriales bacterium]